MIDISKHDLYPAVRTVLILRREFSVNVFPSEKTFGMFRNVYETVLLFKKKTVKEKMTDRHNFFLEGVLFDILFCLKNLFVIQNTSLELEDNFRHLFFKEIRKIDEGNSVRRSITRKVYPKETVHILKSWYDRNEKFPYPSIKQKIELSELTGLTKEQVSAWFTNIRKKRKKRNSF